MDREVPAMNGDEWLWGATANVVLDIAGAPQFANEGELIAIPTQPGLPHVLTDYGAGLWRRLALEGIRDSELSAVDRETVLEMAAVGLAARASEFVPCRLPISRPWLSSPVHELVYGLVQSVADHEGIAVLFIKGPVLQVQGLRTTHHSGDVDVWADPSKWRDLVEALILWGWEKVPFDFVDTTYHSMTLRPPEWACEIDVHFRFPGIGIPAPEAFQLLLQAAESHSFAGVSARTPSSVAHAVILALHKTRPLPGNPAVEHALQEAVTALVNAGPETIAEAERLGSLEVLRLALQSAFPDEQLPAAGGGIPDDWKWRQEPNRARFHLAVLRSLPWSARPMAILRVLWPTGRTAGLSAGQAGRANVRLPVRLIRLLYGVRQLRTTRSRR